jgi:purine-binding chemotaxis protein CheW
MDIAKIRKKAQLKDKERKAKRPPAEPSAETEKREEVKEIQETEQTAVPVDEKGSVESQDQVEGQRIEEQVAEPAAPETPEPEEEEIVRIELLTFGVAQEEFAVRVSEVEEIVHYQSVTKVPTLPEYVVGISSLRGKIIPVIDLKTRLNLQNGSESGQGTGEDLARQSGSRSQEKILIVSGPKGLIGVTIDRVIGVVSFPQNKVLEPPANLTEAQLKYIEGVVILEKKFISLIRLEDTLEIELT